MTDSRVLLLTECRPFFRCNAGFEDVLVSRVCSGRRRRHGGRLAGHLLCCVKRRGCVRDFQPGPAPGRSDLSSTTHETLNREQTPVIELSHFLVRYLVTWSGLFLRRGSSEPETGRRGQSCCQSSCATPQGWGGGVSRGAFVFRRGVALRQEDVFPEVTAPTD